MPTVPEIETCRLGERIVFHARQSGALILSNEIGLETLSYQRSGRGLQALAERISKSLGVSLRESFTLVETTIANWRDAGLFEEATRSFPGSGSHRTPGNAACELGFSLRGVKVLLRSENANLAGQVEAILSPYLSTAKAIDPVLIDVLQTGDKFLVYCDGVATWGLADEDEARYLVLRECVEALCGASNVATIFHAGCAENNGSCVLFPGPTGAGKSTLALGLVGAGWSYVADDLVALHRDGASVISLPMHAGLKEGSRDLAEIKELKKTFKSNWPSPRAHVEYFFPENSVEAGSFVPIRAVVLPKWGPQSEFSFSRILPEDALPLIVRSGSDLSRRSRSVAPLVRLLGSVPCYSIQYSNLKEAVEICSNLADANPS